MNILTELVGSLTREETRHLKLFLNRTQAGSDRKDIALFDFIRKSIPDYKEEKILKKLYDKEDKNALYRLKNRLLEDIGRSITLQYYNTIDTGAILNQLILTRLYRQKGNFRLAYYYLNKAEKKGQKIQNYELLELIYTEFIRLSHESLSINPEDYINKRKNVREKLSRLREIDDILAVLIYRIKRSQNFSAQNYQIIELLQKTINDFSHSDAVKESSQLRFRIYHAVSRILLQQRDYKSLEDYLLVTLRTFREENLFNKNNHDTKLQMLTYLSNSLFKNNKQKQSLKHAEELKAAMSEFGGLLHDKYLFYYYNILINNYSVLDNKKAMEVLNEARDNTVINKSPMNIVVLYLNLALHFFDNREFKKASKHIVMLKLNDSYNKIDNAFKLKIQLVELIIRHDLHDHDFIEAQVKNINKEFWELLQTSDYNRQSRMLDILSKMNYVQTSSQQRQLKTEIQQLIDSIPTEQAGDSDILNYNEWLLDKVR